MFLLFTCQMIAASARTVVALSRSGIVSSPALGTLYSES